MATFTESNISTVEQHRENYTECKDRLKPLQEEMKTIKKQMGPSLKFLRKHMEEHDMEVMDLGNGEELRAIKKTAVKYNEDNMNEFFTDPSTVARYKEQFSHEKMSFSVKRKRVEE